MNKDDDFLFDNEGNLSFTDPEIGAQYLRNHILNGLQNIIGNPVDSPATKQAVYDTVSNVFQESKSISSFNNISVKTRWESMGWKGRLEWYFMKSFFPRKVREMRAVIDRYNNVLQECSLIICSDAINGQENDELQTIEGKKMDYPNWCHPNPKQVVDIKANLALAQPLQYIKIDMDIPKTN